MSSKMRYAVRVLGLLVLVAGAGTAMGAASVPLPPVVIIPGLCGSQMEARLTEAYDSAPHWYCPRGSKNSDWKRVWFSLKDYVVPSCVDHEMQVRVAEGPDGSLRYSNIEGVEIRPVDFGGVGGIGCLDPQFCGISSYFNPLIKALETRAGYVVNETLFGAPYDFRLAGDGLVQDGFEANLTALIEGAVAKNGNRTVTLIGHSMGGMVATYFLAGKPADWIERHVGGLMTISSPYGGSPLALQGSISGASIGLPIMVHAFLGIQDNSPSGPWLYPSQGLWNASVPMVRTRNKSYPPTAKGFADLLQDLGRREQSIILPRVRNMRGIDFDAEGGPSYPSFPNLRHVCFHGNKRNTPGQLTYPVDNFYEGDSPPSPLVTSYVDGDGIVDIKSLKACENVQGMNTEVIAIEGEEHVQILHSEELARQVLAFLVGDHDRQTH